MAAQEGGGAVVRVHQPAPGLEAGRRRLRAGFLAAPEGRQPGEQAIAQEHFDVRVDVGVAAAAARAAGAQAFVAQALACLAHGGDDVGKQ